MAEAFVVYVMGGFMSVGYVSLAASVFRSMVFK